MANIMLLPQTDIVRLNPDRLTELCLQLGDQAAEEAICATMEDLVRYLAKFKKLYGLSGTADLDETINHICDRANHIGLTSLSQVALDVRYCLQQGNGPALAATTARMLRVASRSLTPTGNNKDLSV